MKQSERSENKPFENQRLEVTLQELEAVREAYRSLYKRLALADSVIGFYANPANYKTTRDAVLMTVFQDRLVGDYEEAANDSRTKVAGARARAYQKLHENLPNSRL
jgi:hypothetical protein